MMNVHTAKAFDTDLQELSRSIGEMGGLAEREFADAIQALTRRDSALAMRVVAADPTIDALQREIEELIDELKAEYTLVIVTHNMQQAARVSDYTAFFWLGKLIEFDRTDKIFTAPSEKTTEDYVTGRFG